MRLIDADALWKEFCRSEAIEERYGSGVLEIAGSIIDNAPTIDAVPVVRCKDCIYYDNLCRCDLLGIPMERLNFCSYGERKDNG